MIPSVVPTTSPQNLHIEGGHVHGWRAGDIIKALVAGNADNGLTQLMVGDTPLTVRLPVALKPSTPVILVVKHSSEHGLVLEIKMPHGDGAGTAHPALSVSPPLAEAEDQTLLNSKLALRGAVDAVLMDLLGKAQTPAVGTPFIPHPLAAQMVAAKTTNRRGGADFASAFADIAADALPADTASPEEEKIRATPLAPHSNSGAPPPDLASSSGAARTNVMQFMLPGMAERMEIQVFEEDDEGLRHYSSDGTGRSVTARFTIASDSFGAVHAILRQNGEAVSVGLWAERADVAADLQRDQAELRDGLQCADVAVETIDVFAGSPPAGPAKPKRSIT